MSHRPIHILILFLLLIAGKAFSADPVYNPLAVTDHGGIDTLDLSLSDKVRDREIPLRVYLPAKRAPAPVVLFSHGLGGSRKGNVYLGNHWAARGYVVVFLQHPGSDVSVWRHTPLGRRMPQMKRAAGPRNFLLRVKDIPVTIDQLEHWNATDDHVLAGCLDLKRIGMSGHSFGAVTTQAVSGQTFGRTKAFTDLRIKAAIAFSPSCPRRGGNPKQAFGLVEIPWMLMTGTKDIAPIGGADLKSRLAVFAALPPGGKYELVLYRAEHSAFTEHALPGDTGKRNLNHHRVILALSTAFWDAYLRVDTAAKAWLDGEGPRSVLEDNDRWQRK